MDTGPACIPGLPGSPWAPGWATQGACREVAGGGGAAGGGAGGAAVLGEEGAGTLGCGLWRAYRAVAGQARKPGGRNGARRLQQAGD